MKFQIEIWLLCLFLLAVQTQAQTSFVNWESPQISPLDVTPNGLILAVNTADNRLEVIDTVGGVLNSIPVGLDPVSVRARSNEEAWVVNHISDTISIVDLQSGNVVQTLYTDDEPTDVVFAGTPERAFVSVSQRNKIAVFDPNNLNQPPTFLEIEGEDPRSLATDGVRVYAAIFESGNKSFSIDEFDVSDGAFNPYPGTPNPPPNFGASFNPPIGGGLPTPPHTSIIVKKNAANQWLDDNGGDWSAWANSFGFDMHDHDVAIIDANSLQIEYATGLMNANMAITSHPNDGAVIVGTDAINEVRYEANLNSQFVRVKIASIDSAGATQANQDLNPHLDYSVTKIEKSELVKSVGDPRGLRWSPDGTRLYVTGMGSNNVIELDQNLNRLRRVVVGQGPTGVRVNDDFVYVLNRFDGTVSVIDRVSFLEINQIAFFDPTPDVIKDGRPFLYNTHLSSGLGQVSCGSCHIDARMDRLAWDLGAPDGSVKSFDQNCDFLPICEDWHPMKGPFTTQTLVGLEGSAPFHWRGDRGDLPEFNSTFVNLQGRENPLSPQEMSAFEDFVMTIKYPPNPNRNIDNSLPTNFSNGGDAQMGFTMFNFGLMDNPFQCSDCHALPLGTNGNITPAVLDQQAQSMKVPQLRNMYEKTGRDDNSSNNNSGFGFVHDGTFDSLESFFSLGVFTFQNAQEIDDMVAYMMCFSEDFHASVGTQVTVPTTVVNAPASIAQIVGFANSGQVELIAKGRIAGETRGFMHIGGEMFQSDRQQQQFSLDELIAMSGNGNELTFTVVPNGTSARIGIDRDEDGFFDRDEIDQCSNPADSNSIPNPNLFLGDVNGDGVVNLLDVEPFVNALSNGIYIENADVNCDGAVNLLDVQPFIDILSGS